MRVREGGVAVDPQCSPHTKSRLSGACETTYLWSVQRGTRPPPGGGNPHQLLGAILDLRVGPVERQRAVEGQRRVREQMLALPRSDPLREHRTNLPVGSDHGARGAHDGRRRSRSVRRIPSEKLTSDDLVAIAKCRNGATAKRSTPRIASLACPKYRPHRGRLNPAPSAPPARH